MREGTALGCIALCAHCKYAIQLRRDRWRDDDGHWQEQDIWVHFREPITPHFAAPCAEVGAYYDNA
jgi:hypothetical protein